MKYITWFISVCALFYALYLIWQSQDPQIVSSKDEAANEQPVVLEVIELYDYEGNIIKWRINAQLARIFEKQELTILNDLKGKIYSKQPDEEATRFKADQAHLEGKNKLALMTGDVKVDFNDGKQLFTDRLIYDQKKEIIYNQDDTKITDDRDRMEAKSFHFDIKTQILTLTKAKMLLFAK